ncbi:MAG TPA: delta-60 repeat domain-containing protein, partial [Pirellulales bacterium]|nr:delta-60 repeat domain-containing protein [Pirellulales bacterium]
MSTSADLFRPSPVRRRRWFKSWGVSASWRKRRPAFENLEGRALLSAQGLDAQFAQEGIATTAFSGNHNLVNAIAVQSDGKLVAVGASQLLVQTTPDITTISSGYAMARYNVDGSLDTTFGSGGKIEASLVTGNFGADDVAIQNDGKLVVVGSDGLSRYNSDGSVDSSFGTNGVVSGGIGPWVGLHGDKIVTAGSSSSSGLRRFNADGSLDTTFGEQGVVSGPSFGQFVIDGLGRIIVVTGVDTIARYTSSGLLDTTFGNSGQVTVPEATRSGDTQRVALAPDGKIIWASSI